MESTQQGFILHGKANVPLAQLTFDEQVIIVPCALVKALGAKLPTSIIVQVKDDRGETRGFTGICPAT